MEAYDTGFVPTATTTVASSVNPSTVGQGVTYTATVAPTPDGGTVAFTDSGTTLTGCGAVSVNTSTGKGGLHDQLQRGGQPRHPGQLQR